MPKPQQPIREDVTPERAAKGEFVSAGMARKLVPVITTLRNSHQITIEEWAALDYYRERAHKAQEGLAEESSLSPSRIMGGSRSTVISGPIPAGLTATPAMIETAQIERNLGELAHIARAVAVDDLTLEQVCIQRHGGRERKDRGIIRIVMRGRDGSAKIRLAQALWELREAARRIINGSAFSC